MHDFPSGGEVLVRPAVRGVESPMMNACFITGSWDLYAHGYEEAATRLYEWIEENASGQDVLVYPFVFNWRQVVELRLKHLIVLARFLNDEPPMTTRHHGLERLWVEARRLMTAVEPHESFDAVGEVIRQLDQLDPDSQRTRYPIHKKDGESFPPGTPNLCLSNFQTVMLKLSAFFEAATGHFGRMADYKGEGVPANDCER